MGRVGAEVDIEVEHVILFRIQRAGQSIDSQGRPLLDIERIGHRCLVPLPFVGRHFEAGNLRADIADGKPALRLLAPLSQRLVPLPTGRGLRCQRRSERHTRRGLQEYPPGKLLAHR